MAKLIYRNEQTNKGNNPMLYKLKSSKQLMTYDEALEFLYVCHGITVEHAHKFMVPSKETDNAI